MAEAPPRTPRALRLAQRLRREPAAVGELIDRGNVHAARQPQQKGLRLVIDRMADRGIIHKNKASNLKSSLTKHVNKLA